jgi:hypothetical protein
MRREGCLGNTMRGDVGPYHQRKRSVGVIADSNPREDAMGRPKIEITSAPTRYPDAFDGARRFATDVRSRPDVMSRRTMLRDSGRLIMVFVAPLSISGCDEPEDIKTAILFLIEALQYIGRVVKGDVDFTNPNDRCRTYQLALDLFTVADYETGAAASTGLLKFESCKDKATVPLEAANLRPLQEGNHFVQTLFDGQDWVSDGFKVQ